ncbi:MAG: hypothetical protein EZS28_053097, partial [Streblomastix strix]
GGRRSPL